jgi:hypothetical protein
MSETVKNLGIVKAIFVGNTPPINTDALWKDTSLVIPLHKWYNTSSSQWEALVNTVLIDNITIKRDVEGRIYVDPAEVEEFVIADGSITFLKLINVASGSVLYRKTAGDGPVEATDLATLKADLGLTGDNSGDQDLTLYALKSYTINGKTLDGDIILTPEDIGSPAGSGTSTGENTGDETKETILAKLLVDDVISSTILADELLNYVEKEEGKSLVSDADIAKLSSLTRNVYTITLPNAANVQARCTAAVEVTDYPEGWVISAGTNPIDFKVVHGLGKRIASVTVFYSNGGVERQLFNNSAYSGVFSSNPNELVIESLATIGSPIIIHLIFA